METSITKNRRIVYKIIAFIFWILVWEIIALLINKEIYLPTPYNTFKVLVSEIKTAMFWQTVFSTIFRVAIGFFIACIIGIIFGIICGVNKFIYEILNLIIVAVKSTPVMSFILIAVIWFKSDNVPIFICFLMCFPIIWTSVVGGINNIDKRLIDMAYVYKVDKKYIVKDIYIPSIVPYITTAMITSLGLGWKVTVAAEVLSSPKFSIGTKLYDAKVYVESEQLFAWTIVVIALSLILEYIFKYLLRKILPVRIQK
ncbi:ABC transporter permease [Vallitalea longa]|uniref:ABC transporter permease n=1 Tax=Vallitalea longa TaxID=2936439 RepID=A0A9W5YDH6_9FIRM|nr:ABC transporter permease subunit [Vallitalea longa]GKX29919.1 ABC transporter permease [Vallitalea longa]